MMLPLLFLPPAALRWAELQGFTITILDRVQGEEAGVKAVEFLVDGRYVRSRAPTQPALSPRLSPTPRAYTWVGHSPGG